MPRCPWATTEPNITYHDEEWGVPVHDDRKLFEFLILEGAQAGLSWTTILKKRANYRRALDRFHPEKIARYGSRDVKRLLADPGIVRNRLKIAATIQNAKAFLEVRKEFRTFDRYAWAFSDAVAFSKDLRKRGFKFVGPTIVESFMEATGMLDHHEPGCFRKGRGRAPGGSGARPATLGG